MYTWRHFQCQENTFEQAVGEVLSKIQTRCLHLPQQLLLFFKTWENQPTFMPSQGRNEWAQFPGHRATMGASNHYEERRMTAGAPKSPNNVTSTFFSRVHLLPKDLKFEHGGAKLASCPGLCLTSLRPCMLVCHAPAIRCEYTHHTGEACFACGCRNSYS